MHIRGTGYASRTPQSRSIGSDHETSFSLLSQPRNNASDSASFPWVTSLDRCVATVSDLAMDSVPEPESASLRRNQYTLNAALNPLVLFAAAISAPPYHEETSGDFWTRLLIHIVLLRDGDWSRVSNEHASSVLHSLQRLDAALESNIYVDNVSSDDSP
jgi:hypothetical protein